MDGDIFLLNGIPLDSSGKRPFEAATTVKKEMSKITKTSAAVYLDLHSFSDDALDCQLTVQNVRFIQNLSL